MDILSDLNARGYTIVMVTHDARYADRSSRQITIRDGRIAFVGGNQAAQAFIGADSEVTDLDTGRTEDPTVELTAEDLEILPLAGEGAYIGRMALWELDYEPDMPEGRCGWHVRGLVIAADDLPAVPEAAGP